MNIAYEFTTYEEAEILKEEAEDISHNLICFASKISTPEAVKQAVVDRQITTKAQLLDAVNDANERDDASGSAAEPVRQPEIHQKVTTQRNEAGARAPATETKAALRAEIAWAKNAVRCVLVSEAGTVGYSDAMKALQAWADHGRWG